ncbi:hypothetical protein E4T50_07186 [Aureobasidium sp. EXF-12298]|nr:hypothetical protein E4T50_07186 [Aureobasidium sp. EXF-12298]KAI4758457.1 hypothetical protein E4T51_08502 [Aureobasidium sp. EXF-12344]KAI4777132.1 hypothetical protein E4T52_07944 [Aureobasidium sp. EXF-3400]
MSQSPTLPVPPFSRPRSVSQSSMHSHPDGSQEHSIATPQEPLLAQVNSSGQGFQPSYAQLRVLMHKNKKLNVARNVPQIHTPISKNTEKPHSKFSKLTERLETTWYLEIFFLLCSVVCATLIVTFLTIHNNTPIESWTFYFSINTVVSTLGVIFKSTLFIAVSAALAQGKWTWFGKRNGPLSTFEAIDAASRGTLESFKLLWSMRGQHLVSAGALVIALGFMVDPFLQAIISDYGRLVDLDVSAPNSTRATIGKSNNFDGGTQCVSTWPSSYPQIDTTPDFALAAALYDGLNAALSHIYQNVSFTCTSGNCTWTEYTSLAVRSTCFDISSFLKRTTPEDVANAPSTTQTSSSAGSEAVTDSTDVTSLSQPVPSYGEELSHAYSGTSTSDPAPTQSMVQIPAIASSNTSPSEILEGPTYTVLSAFSDVSTVNSEVASVQSTAAEAVGLYKRASSSAQLSSLPSQSSSTWTDWTLEHPNLTLTNTNEAQRNAGNFVVLQAAVVADPNLTINFVTSQTLLAAFIVIRTDNNHTVGSAAWDAANASAMECGLELALNVYNSSVKNNVLMEQVVASASKKVPGSWLPLPPINQTLVDPGNLPVDPGTLESNPIYHHRFLRRYDYALDPTALQTSVNETFTVPQKTLVSTLDFLTSLIRQENDNATVKAVIQEDQTLLYTYGSAILQPLFNQTNTTAVFDAVARSMSNAIRHVGKDQMLGTTQQWVRYYQVRWAFLTLPLSLITSVASETMARLECFPEGFALVAADSPVARISRPTTPARDEEEHEMSNLKIPTTPRTPGSNITLVDPQSIGEASERETIRSVSPVHNGPEWSDVQIDDSSTPLSLGRSL